MRITIHKVLLEPTKLFSKGIGYDDFGEVVEFIGHTKEMSNINDEIQGSEDDELPSIYLKPWQLTKDES